MLRILRLCANITPYEAVTNELLSLLCRAKKLQVIATNLYDRDLQNVLGLGCVVSQRAPLFVEFAQARA